MLFPLSPGSERCNFEQNGPPQCSEDNSVQMLDECDMNDLEDVLSESNDEFIPQGNP
jgi:hypothetical protein